MLSRQIERIRRASMLDRLIVATSTEPSDDPIATWCMEEKVTCSRGSLNDVLDRFYQAAQLVKPVHVVRLTGDCPLADPVLINQLITYHLDNEFDYTTNAIEPTYPDGLDVEVFRYACLEEAWKEAGLPSQREHVTPYINQQPDRYKIGHYKGDKDWSHLRWTVDEQADYELVTAVYDHLYKKKPEFTTNDILEFLQNNPQWTDYNTRYQRNDGYQKSILKDKATKN